MTIEEFDRLVVDQFDKCVDMLGGKAQLYAHGDRLSNFKKAGKLSGCTSAYALWGMVVKHIVALSDYLIALENESIYPFEQWEEKITDIINYLVLLMAILKEEYFADPVHGHGQHNSRPKLGNVELDEHRDAESKVQVPVSDGYQDTPIGGVRHLEKLEIT